MKFRIQQADQRHLADINRLILGAKLIDEPLEKVGEHYWFVRIHGVIVACAALDFYGENGVILTHLVVDKAYRHQEIGTALIAHRMRIAQKGGMRIVALATMYYLFNFYKKRGFKTCPRKYLPNSIKNYWEFTSSRYKKCAVMYKVI